MTTRTSILWLLTAAAFLPGLQTPPGREPGVQMTAEGEAYITQIATSTGISFKEATRREVLRAALVPLTEAVNTDRVNFAEAYRTDEGGNWRAVINFVGTLAMAQERVAHLIPAGAEIEWRHVERSSAFFDQLIHGGAADAMMSAYPDRIQGLGYDTSRNQLVVITVGEQGQIEDAFGESVGIAAVRFEHVTEDQREPIVSAQEADSAVSSDSHGTGCVDNFNCARWRGGIQLGGGSTNMWARRANGSSWLYYVLFAGHAGYKDANDTDLIKVYNLNRADFNNAASGNGLAGGDSGAVVHGGWENGGDGVGWAGIAGPNVGGYFSVPDKIEADLGVSVCLNADCAN